MGFYLHNHTGERLWAIGQNSPAPAYFCLSTHHTALTLWTPAEVILSHTIFHPCPGLHTRRHFCLACSCSSFILLMPIQSLDANSGSFRGKPSLTTSLTILNLLLLHSLNTGHVSFAAANMLGTLHICVWLCICLPSHSARKHPCLVSQCKECACDVVGTQCIFLN